MPGKIKDVDRTPQLLENIEKLGRLQVEVGILGTEGSDILLIARVHEYGVKITVTPKMKAYFRYQGIFLKKTTTTINIPERSFIRAGYDENVAKLEKHITGQINIMLAGRATATEVAGFIGEWLSGELRNFITDLREPALSPITIERRKKKSNNPLVDTGRLRGSINYQIKEV